VPKNDEQGKKRVVVNIMGEEYVLRSSSSQEHMLEVGKHVNSLMEDLAANHPSMSMQKIAVLASLNLASDLLEQLKEKKDDKKKTKKTEQNTGE